MVIDMHDRARASPAQPAATRPAVRRPAWPWWAAAAAVVAFRLWLSATCEIVARGSALDQLRFARMAESLLDGRWLGDYGPFTLIRQPVFPLWIWLAHESGVPLRIANEILLVCAAAAFALALRRVGVGRALSFACFAAVVLQPTSLVWNGELRAESLYAPVLLVALALLFRVAVAERPARCAAASLAAGVPLALLWHMRPESVLIAVLAGAFVAVDAWRWKRRGRGSRWIAARAGLVAGPIACVVAGVGIAIASANAAHYGISVVTDEDAPGYVALKRALLRVRPEHASRYVAIPADARRRAYAASPAFRELEPWLEGDVGRTWASFYQRATHFEGEIGDAWLFWAIRDAAARAGHCSSAPEAERFYAAAAREIDAACDDGRIPARPVLSTALDPDPTAFVGCLPASLGRVLARFARVAAIPGKDDPSTPPDVRDEFTRVARRRPSLTTMTGFRARGWALDSADPVTNVAACGASGERIAEVAATRGDDAGSPSRFQLDVPSSAGPSAGLSLGTASGAEVRVALAERQETVGSLAYRVEYLCETSVDARARRLAQVALAHAQPAVVLLSSAAGLAGLIMLVRRRRRIDWTHPVFAALAAIAVVVGARVLLLALLDASSFEAAQSRYVHPVEALAICGAWIAASLALAPRARCIVAARGADSGHPGAEGGAP
jgi:hypothetical protein